MRELKKRGTIEVAWGKGNEVWTFPVTRQGETARLTFQRKKDKTRSLLGKEGGKKGAGKLPTDIEEGKIVFFGGGVRGAVGRKTTLQKKKREK